MRFDEAIEHRFVKLEAAYKSFIKTSDASDSGSAAVVIVVAALLKRNYKMMSSWKVGRSVGVRINEHMAGKRRKSLITPLGRHRHEAHNGNDCDVKCVILVHETEISARKTYSFSSAMDEEDEDDIAIKPVYILDFGISRKILNSKGELKAPRQSVRFKSARSEGGDVNNPYDWELGEDPTQSETGYNFTAAYEMANLFRTYNYFTDYGKVSPFIICAA
ncbi:hypothetical protein RB195_010992 [Necator americanus]|uniref:Protein kinase domain-containing protein n=1 Tax=Necator americanus TaxID=51031 RepID=A0ABR1D0H4_NECAM